MLTDDIIRMKPVRRYVTISLLGVLGCFYVGIMATTGSTVGLIFGTVLGGICFLVFFLSIKVLISRTLKDTKRRKQDEIIQLVRSTIQRDGKEMSKEVLEDFIQKLTHLLNTMPDEINEESKKNTYQQFNENWKDRIRNTEDNYFELQKIVDELRKKKNANPNDKLIQKLQIALQEALANIASSNERIVELEKEIKKLKGDEDPKL